MTNRIKEKIKIRQIKFYKNQIKNYTRMISMKMIRFFNYIKRRFNAFTMWDIKLYGTSCFFLALFIASFAPRTFEKLRWLWLALFLIAAVKPLAVLCKKESIIDRIRFSRK